MVVRANFLRRRGTREYCKGSDGRVLNCNGDADGVVDTVGSRPNKSPLLQWRWKLSFHCLPLLAILGSYTRSSPHRLTRCSRLTSVVPCTDVLLDVLSRSVNTLIPNPDAGLRHVLNRTSSAWLVVVWRRVLQGSLTTIMCALVYSLVLGRKP